MGPIEAMKRGLTRTFDFTGRSSIPEYWWYTSLAIILLGILHGVPLEDGEVTLGMIAGLFLLPSLISAGCRRIRDAGRSVLLYVVVLVLSLVFQLFAFNPLDTSPAQASLAQVVFLVAAWSCIPVLFWWLISESQPAQMSHEALP